MRFKDTKERFSKYGAEWSHLYISSDGSVKSYSFQKDKRIYLGNIFNNSVEEIFLEMQNKIDKLEIVYQQGESLRFIEDLQIVYLSLCQ